MDAGELRNILLNLRTRFARQQESIRSGALGDTGLHGAPINLAEQASDEREIDLMAERLTASSETLADIDEAIRKIDGGVFNVCEECGGEIGERRLGIRPWSKLCVACQRKTESEGES